MQSIEFTQIIKFLRIKEVQSFRVNPFITLHPTGDPPETVKIFKQTSSICVA